jgi:hypothetical protein
MKFIVALAKVMGCLMKSLWVCLLPLSPYFLVTDKFILVIRSFCAFYHIICLYEQ